MVMFSFGVQCNSLGNFSSWCCPMSVCKMVLEEVRSGVVIGSVRFDGFGQITVWCCNLSVRKMFFEAMLSGAVLFWCTV